ncbi:MAG: ATP-binding protein [Bdellovibrionales bacterium]
MPLSHRLYLFFLRALLLPLRESKGSAFLLLFSILLTANLIPCPALADISSLGAVFITAQEQAPLLSGTGQTGQILLGLFTGVMITAAIYLFFIWLVIRERSQVFLLFFLAALIVNMVSGSDALSTMIDLTRTSQRALVQNYGLLFAYLFSLCFTYYFLELETNAPRMKIPLLILGVILFILLILSGISPLFLEYGLPLLGTLTMTAVIFSGLLAMRVGVSGSLSHIIAFLTFAISTMATPLYDLGYIDQDYIRLSLANAGFSLSAIMFSIIIAGQFAARQEEKERELHISNERFSLAVLGSNEGLFDWNLSTGSVYFSGQFRHLMGVAIESNRRGLKEWLKRVQPSDRKILLKAFRKLRDSNQALALNFEYRIVHGKQERRWIHTKAVGTRDPRSGKLVRIVGSIGDITQRKTGQVALQASEQRFRSITEAHPVPVLIIRLQDELILYASPGAESLLGMPESMLISHNISRFILHQEECKEILDSMGQGQEINMKEISLAHADGHEFPAALSARRINYQNEAAMVVGIYDLTERKEAETKIAQQQEALQQSEKMAALGGLLAGVAHELNNPLSVVMGQSTLLIEGETQPKTKERATKIFKASDRAARIIKSFLALARRKPPERKDFNLNEIIHNSLELLGYQFRNANIALTLELDETLPMVMGDSDQMTQVMTNLALNAAQAMDNWDGPRKLKIKSETKEDNMILVSVIDSGPGIPEELRARVFEPFFTTKSSSGGTGVGLALCHNIIEGHDGHLSIQESPGGGATFLMRLPISQGCIEEVAEEQDLEVPSTGNKYKLLLVDDEVELLQTLADLLEPLGHEIDLAANGEIAIRKLQKTKFDAIISDLRMPVMDGPTMYAQICRTLPDYKDRIIYVTGDTLSPHVNEFLKNNPVLPVIEKPYRLADVLTALEALFKDKANDNK